MENPVLQIKNLEKEIFSHIELEILGNAKQLSFNEGAKP